MKHHNLAGVSMAALKFTISLIMPLLYNPTMTMVSLSPQEIRALEEFKQRLMQRFGDEVVTMTLFGSRARGEGNEDSDVDVLIMTRSESRKRRDAILDMANDILLEYEIDIAPMVVGEVRYRTILDREWQIGKEIQRDGQLL